jgi:cobalt-precorrin 5A hydrolase
VNPESLVAVNSALVNEEKLALVFVGNVNVPLDKSGDYEIKTAENTEQAKRVLNGFDAGAIIINEKITLDGLKKPATILKQKKVAVGIGSRKNVNPDDIVETVTAALKQCNIPLERVDRLATVDIKKDSESMKKAAQQMGLKLEYISVEALRAFKHEDLSADSEFVKEKIGVGGVCERAALIVAGKKPKLILKKTKSKGVTAAIAEGE